MPVVNPGNVGATAIVNGVLNEFRDIVVTPAAAATTGLNSQTLACAQNPNLNYYVSVAPAGIVPFVEIQPQFSIRMQDNAATQRWLPLGPIVLLPASQNIMLVFSNVPANFIRFRFTVGPDPAQTPITISMLVQASAS